MGRLMGYTIPYARLRFFMGMIHGISDDTLYVIPTAFHWPAYGQSHGLCHKMLNAL